MGSRSGPVMPPQVPQGGVTVSGAQPQPQVQQQPQPQTQQLPQQQAQPPQQQAQQPAQEARPLEPARKTADPRSRDASRERETR
jgi:hypothetical protein